MKDLTHLTKKHKAVVKHILNGESVANASMLAGYSQTYGQKLAQIPKFRKELECQIAKAGITDSLLATKLREGLDSMVPPRKEGGKLHADNFVRKQYLDVIFKLRGDYAPERTEITEKQVIINFDADLLKALRDSRAIDMGDVEILEQLPLGEMVE